MHKPVKQIPLFPTASSLSEATAIIHSHLPITDENKLQALLMMYQNTMIQEMEKTNVSSNRKYTLIQESR